MIDTVQINLVTSSGPTRIVNGVAPGLRVKKFRRLGHNTTLTEEMNSFHGDDRKMISDDPLWVYYVSHYEMNVKRPWHSSGADLIIKITETHNKDKMLDVTAIRETTPPSMSSVNLENLHLL